MKPRLLVVVMIIILAFQLGCGDLPPQVDTRHSINRTFTVHNYFGFPITVYNTSYQSCDRGAAAGPPMPSYGTIVITVSAGATSKFMIPGGYGAVVCLDPFGVPTCGTFELQGFQEFNNNNDNIYLKNGFVRCPNQTN